MSLAERLRKAIEEREKVAAREDTDEKIIVFQPPTTSEPHVVDETSRYSDEEILEKFSVEAWLNAIKDEVWQTGNVKKVGEPIKGYALTHVYPAPIATQEVETGVIQGQKCDIVTIMAQPHNSSVYFIATYGFGIPKQPALTNNIWRYTDKTPVVPDLALISSPYALEKVVAAYCRDIRDGNLLPLQNQEREKEKWNKQFGLRSYPQP